MRRVKATNTLIVVTDQTKEFYKDEWDGNLLLYTGMGKTGDQKLNGNQNITLYESNSNGVTIHLFEVLEKTEYTYRGIAHLVKEPYTTVQKDQLNNDRIVWVFPLMPEKKRIFVSKDIERTHLNIELDTILINEELNEGTFKLQEFTGYKKTPQQKKKPKQRNKYNMYTRDRKVALNALAGARYTCEINSKHPSFIRKKVNVMYTEPHHLIPMEFSDQFDVSLDTEENIVSLCSNCHNEIHYGRERFSLLEQLYNSRKELLKSVGINITFQELREMYR